MHLRQRLAERSAARELAIHRANQAWARGQKISRRVWRQLRRDALEDVRGRAATQERQRSG